MFEFYRDCTFMSSSSWITPLAQTISAIAASFAFIIAVKNLGGTKKTQSLQAQMNLITLENEVRKNCILYKDAASELSIPQKDMRLIFEKKINAFEIYLSSADKLAALINAEYLNSQFPERNWESEYREIFVKVVDYHKGEDTIIPGKNEMIRNIVLLLDKWSKEEINK